MTDSDARSEAPRPIPVAEFEGDFVRVMRAKLPAITLEMEEGWPRNTHLKLEVEVRVRNIRYEEDRKGDLIREHTLVIEEVRMLGAYSPDEADPGVGGSASAAARAEDEEDEEEQQVASDLGVERVEVCDWSGDLVTECQHCAEFPAFRSEAAVFSDVGF